MIVRISDVRLYIEYRNEGAVVEGVRIRKLLDDEGVPYIIMAYMDDAQLPDVLSALSTWSWGKERRKEQLTTFPLVTWSEHHDDFTTEVQVAKTLGEVQSLLLPHKANVTA